MTELITGDELFFENQFKVVELYVQAENPTVIARKLGMKRKDVLGYIETWRQSGAVNEVMKDRVYELIHGLDEHYSLLIRKAWEIIKSVDDDGATSLLKEKTSAIKTIADLEEKRIAVLQRSGMLDNDELGAEIVEMERQKEIILDILKNDLCDVCRPTVQRKVGEMLQKPQPLVVYDD